MSLDFDRDRALMVQEQLLLRGISDESVLSAMGEVPRHEFVQSYHAHDAYRDGPLPIGYDQTISQPYIVALMLELACLQADSRVLEVGTGSGYGAAVLSRCCSHVYTVERITELLDKAQQRFQDLGYFNISSKLSDGSVGWLEEAPLILL